MAEYRDRRKEEERVKAVRNDRGALMNERSRRVQIERKKKLRKKKQRRRVLVSALVEVLILTVLAIAFCWNRGLEAKVSGLTGWFDGPPVTGLDMSGVNSSNVVLMDVKSGKVIGEMNGEERIYPASMTKIMTAIVHWKLFQIWTGRLRLVRIFFMHWMGRMRRRRDFSRGRV